MKTTPDPMRATITLHGLGFIQVQLPGDQRLHVWHPDLPRRACFQHSAVHNHRFSFTSQILVGKLIDQPHTVTPDDAGTHIAYSHNAPRTKSGGRPWSPIGNVTLQPHPELHYNPGTRYYVEAYAYHLSRPSGDGKVATLLTKHDEGEQGATSLCKAGIEPDAEFDRYQLPAHTLWRYVLEVLGATHHLELVLPPAFCRDLAQGFACSEDMGMEIPPTLCTTVHLGANQATIQTGHMLNPAGEEVATLTIANGDTEVRLSFETEARAQAVLLAMVARGPDLPMSHYIRVDDGSLAEAALAFADAARPNLYPLPDKPNSAFGKLQNLDAALHQHYERLSLLKQVNVGYASNTGQSAAPLACKHNGMRIDASGVLNRVGGHLKFGAREMLKHLEEMADRFYAGDLTAVDEFLQLYCLDEKRPAEHVEGQQL